LEENYSWYIRQGKRVAVGKSLEVVTLKGTLTPLEKQRSTRTLKGRPMPWMKGKPWKRQKSQVERQWERQ
jgi:hypothetical protein